jgi:hypothetical protein
MPDANFRMSSSSAPASEKEPAVFDASPLVFFDVLGYTGLLPELHRVLIPRPWSRSSSRYPESSAVVYGGGMGRTEGARSRNPAKG